MSIINIILVHEVSDMNFFELAADKVATHTSNSHQHEHQSISGEHIIATWTSDKPAINMAKIVINHQLDFATIQLG